MTTLMYNKLYVCNTANIIITIIMIVIMMMMMIIIIIMSPNFNISKERPMRDPC